MAEILAIRGKKSTTALQTLLEKKLVAIVGRKPVVGRPILYGTSRDFLIHFGLKDLSELPTLEEFAELLGEKAAAAVAALPEAAEQAHPPGAGEPSDQRSSEPPAEP
jgi:segregation and condensation protein B